MKTVTKLLGIGLLTMAMVIDVGCSALVPDPNLQAQRDIARSEALTAQANAQAYEGKAQLTIAEGDVHIRKVQAETSARILEMHEIVAADMERLIVNQNAFVDAINNHQAAMVNQSYLLQQQFDMMKDIEFNSHAAAENSWFANIGVIVLAVALLGLIGLVILLFARVERLFVKGESEATNGKRINE